MAFNFEFRTLQDRRDLTRFIGFAGTQTLNYPAYEKWLERVEAEILAGSKTAALVLSDRIVVGDIVWQMHKELSGTREIKNLRLHPAVRGQYFSKVLLRQAERPHGEKFNSLILDYREDHPDLADIKRTLVSMNYRIIATVNLYDPNVRDVVAFKDLDKAA